MLDRRGLGAGVSPGGVASLLCHLPGPALGAGARRLLAADRTLRPGLSGRALNVARADNFSVRQADDQLA